MKEFIKNLKRTWIYARNQKLRLKLYIFFNIISIIISIVVPVITAKIIVKLTSNLLYQVLLISLVLMLAEWTRNVSRYFMRLYSQIIYRETFKEIQINLGKEILKLETECLDNNSSGVFIQRLTNDTTRIAELFGMLSDNLMNIMTDLGIFVAVFIINKWAFLYLVITVIFLYIIEKRRVSIRNENDKIFRKNVEKLYGFVGELVRGSRDIKMLNAEKGFMSELKNKIVTVNNQRYSMSKIDRNYNFARSCFIDLFDMGMIALLVFLIMSNNMDIASALIIHNYMPHIVAIINYVSNLLERVKDYNLSCERIFAIMGSEEFKKEKFGNIHLDKVKGNFEFKNVSFSYGKQKILKNINFKVNADETVAFVGKSGAGKSTIFNLLCKMYDIDSGEILIDGVNIKELDKESIRGNITIINQNPYIFNLSIRDNLRLVKDNMTDEEMINACKLACLDEFIETLPDKYDTIIGEGGVNLSGGQRQRLAIARALIQKTEIILFDEATSNLDNETQTSIQKAIENLQTEYTIFIIAHRLSTIINSNRILFLDNGKIIAEGTHNELIKNCKKYKELYEAEIQK